jgi:hypothetical protein
MAVKKVLTSRELSQQLLERIDIDQQLCRQLKAKMVTKERQAVAAAMLANLRAAENDIVRIINWGRM